METAPGAGSASRETSAGSSKSATAKPPKRAAAKRLKNLPAEPSKSSVVGPPRKPVQVLRDKPTSRAFWVFCDDGSVWVARHKKGSLRWMEAGPPLPGSPEDRRGALSAEGAKPTESA